MQLVISGRHTHLTKTDKEQIEKKLEKYKKKLPDLLKAEVVLNLEGERHDMEIIVHIPHTNPLVARTSAASNTMALDLAIQKMDNLVSKHLGKKHDLHK